jgi:hypothetical protein
MVQFEAFIGVETGAHERIPHAQSGENHTRQLMTAFFSYLPLFSHSGGFWQLISKNLRKIHPVIQFI